MSVIECRIQVFDVCIRFQSDRIPEQAEIQITFSFYLKLSGIFSSQGYFSHDVIV